MLPDVVGYRLRSAKRKTKQNKKEKKRQETWLVVILLALDDDQRDLSVFSYLQMPSEHSFLVSEAVRIPRRAPTLPRVDS